MQWFDSVLDGRVAVSNYGKALKYKGKRWYAGKNQNPNGLLGQHTKIRSVIPVFIREKEYWKMILPDYYLQGSQRGTFQYFNFA